MHTIINNWWSFHPYDLYKARNHRSLRCDATRRGALMRPRQFDDFFFILCKGSSSHRPAAKKSDVVSGELSNISGR